MKLTAHSEVKSLNKVYLQKVSNSFKDQVTIDENWESLNYLDRPDFAKALKEYGQFEDIFRKIGCEISYFGEDGSTGMDSIYCRDASIVTDFGIILCRMGKPLRSGEPNMQRKYYEKNGGQILGVIEAPGLLEGGDVAWIDEKTLAVAHGYRTNDSGYEQLRSYLNPLGVEVIQVPLPHYKGPSDVFHLMSIFSPIDDDLAVVYSPLMPVMFRNLLLDRGYQLIEVPDGEFESMGCNVLAISPSKCLIVAGNPITQSRLEEAGCEVTAYEGRHISVMGGGGPTCLTRPMLRG